MINLLIREANDICKPPNRSIHTFDDDEIKGVSFAPGRSEAIFLTFNKEGRILSNISCT